MTLHITLTHCVIENESIFTFPLPLAVLRLNTAPVRGFQRDTGSRTTIRLVYPEAAPPSPDDYRNTSMVALVVFKSLDLDWLTSVITKRPLVRAPISLLSVVPAFLIKAVGTQTKSP